MTSHRSHSALSAIREIPHCDAWITEPDVPTPVIDILKEIRCLKIYRTTSAIVHSVTLGADWRDAYRPDRWYRTLCGRENTVEGEIPSLETSPLSEELVAECTQPQEMRLFRSTSGEAAPPFRLIIFAHIEGEADEFKCPVGMLASSSVGHFVSLVRFLNHAYPTVRISFGWDLIGVGDPDEDPPA